MAWSGKRTRPAVDLPCRSHSSIGSQATQRRLNSPHFSLWAVGYLRSPLNRSTPHCKCCLLAPGCTNFLRDVLLAASCAIARRSCACDVTCHQPESILLLVVIETRMQQSTDTSASHVGNHSNSRLPQGTDPGATFTCKVSSRFTCFVQRRIAARMQSHRTSSHRHPDGQILLSHGHGGCGPVLQPAAGTAGGYTFAHGRGDRQAMRGTRHKHFSYIIPAPAILLPNGLQHVTTR